MSKQLKPVWILLILGFTVGAFWILWLRQRGPHEVPGTHAESSDIAWMSNEKDALALGVKKKMPVVIDFSAEWCMPCQEMDATVFHDPEVVRRMQSVIPLRLDVTNDTPTEQALLDRYGVRGLPTIVFINAEGHILESPRILGGVSSEEFLSALDALQG